MSTPSHAAVSKGSIDLYPLSEFYARAGRGLPWIEPADEGSIPEPYRSLLVHLNDMTSTLEKFHGARIHLEVLRREVDGDEYFREVVLQLDGGNEPVEFGAIKMHLGRFAAGPRARILAGVLPLGRILQDDAVPHLSRPKGFFKLRADAFMAGVLGCPPQQELFGRRNTLVDPAGGVLAEIVEILPRTGRS